MDGVSLYNLTPTLVHTGVSVSPASGSAQDFTSQRTYAVTAEDGSTKKYLEPGGRQSNLMTFVTNPILGSPPGPS